MKVKKIKFYQAIEFGKNKALTFLDLDGYKKTLHTAYIEDLQMEEEEKGIRLSGSNVEDMIIPYNNVAFYQPIKETKKAPKA